MQTRLRFLAVIAAMLCMPILAFAKNNAAPLGFELGVATYAQIKHAYPGVSVPVDAGLPEPGYTESTIDGSALNIEGVERCDFTFNQQKVLSGVSLTMTKDINGAVKLLSRKYKMTGNHVDSFMGNGSAFFSKGHSTIVVIAKQLSFDMNVVYIMNNLRDSIIQNVRKDKANSQRRKESAL